MSNIILNPLILTTSDFNTITIWSLPEIIDWHTKSITQNFYLNIDKC